MTSNPKYLKIYRHNFSAPKQNPFYDKTFSAFALSLLLIAGSCKNGETKTSDAQVTTTTIQQVAENSVSEGTSSKIVATQVPDSVRMSFAAKYPRASAAQWTEYKPVANDDEMNADYTYYYVQFMNEGENITSWYDNSGNWVKTSVRIPGDSRLPDAVNKTLNEQYPGYKIDELDKENDKDTDMYEIKLKKGDDKVKLKILPDGRIFKRK